GVLLGLGAVRLTGWVLLDPIIALGVAFLILRTGYQLIKKSAVGLVDIRLPAEEEGVIKASLQEHYGELLGFHDLRTRKAGRERHIDLHLVVAKGASVERAHQLCDHLESDIVARLPHSRVNIHIEPCERECEGCPTGCPQATPAPEKPFVP
ncbi:MAG: cation diffusion facilitator family transporter, partial [Chloroflexota bacterium]|nr:cation diffusion facilitator family transporter [Chloroflexota bacterium]